MTRKRRKSPRILAAGPKARKKVAAAAKRDPLYEFIETGTRSLNLKIDKAWLPSIGENILVIWRHGITVERIALPDEIDPAPVFEP